MLKEEQKTSSVRKFDIFGITPKLFVDNKEKYQTIFGASMTFILSIHTFLNKKIIL